jgi:hypothetical protein
MKKQRQHVLEDYETRKDGGGKRQKTAEVCTICLDEATEENPFVEVFLCKHKVMHDKCAQQDILTRKDPGCPVL